MIRFIFLIVLKNTEKHSEIGKILFCYLDSITSEFWFIILSFLLLSI